MVLTKVSQAWVRWEDSYIDGQGCAEAGEPRKVFLGLAVRKGFPEEGPLELDLGGAGGTKQGCRRACGKGISA